MISLGNAAFAKTTVLGARRLEESTCFTHMPRMEHSVIVRVQRHVVCVVLGCDIAWVNSACQVEEDIRERNGDNDSDFCSGSDLGPCLRNKQALANYHNEQKKELDRQLTIVLLRQGQYDNSPQQSNVAHTA
jgi:hypothetical protein